MEEGGTRSFLLDASGTATVSACRSTDCKGSTAVGVSEDDTSIPRPGGGANLGVALAYEGGTLVPKIIWSAFPGGNREIILPNGEAIVEILLSNDTRSTPAFRSPGAPHLFLNWVRGALHTYKQAMGTLLGESGGPTYQQAQFRRSDDQIFNV